MLIPFLRCYKLIHRNKTAGVYRYHYHSSTGLGRNWTARADFLNNSVRERTRKDLVDDIDDDGDDRVLTKQPMIRNPETKLNETIELSSTIVDPDPVITLSLRTPVKKMFRGMVIPEKPKPPGSDECCMSGCAICVYDIYITSLEAYRDALKVIRTTLQSQRVPISEWPNELILKKPNINNDNAIQLQRQDDGPDSDSELDVSLSAFAELEKSLRLKKTE